MGFICCGCATGLFGTEGWIQQVSLTFGLCITVLAYSIGHYSGGHINGAVTLGLVVACLCPIAQGVANFVAQMLGSLFGAFLLFIVVPKDADLTGGYGSNTLDEKYDWNQAMIGEIICTSLLMFTVLQTAVNEKSINPTRSFGPAVVASIVRSGEAAKFWKHMYLFWVGPVIGSLLGVILYKIMECPKCSNEAVADVKAEV